MLVVVDGHGLRIDVRFQGVVGVGQGRRLKGHLQLLVTGIFERGVDFRAKPARLNAAKVSARP